jgi:hypothetical protein
MGGYRLPLEQGSHFFGPTVARAVFSGIMSSSLGMLDGAITPR